MRSATASGITAFVLALPGAFMLTELVLLKALAWAAVAALVAGACVFAWLKRHPSGPITIGVCVAVAMLTYAIVVVAFALQSELTWQRSLIFIGMSLVLYCWYPAMAGATAFMLMSRLSTWGIHVA